MCVYSIYIYKRGETAGDCVGDNQSVANLDLHFAASVLYNIPKVLGAKKKNGCNDTSEPRKPSEYLQVFGHKTMHTLLSGQDRTLPPPRVHTVGLRTIWKLTGAAGRTIGHTWSQELRGWHQSYSQIALTQPITMGEGVNNKTFVSNL